MRKSMVAIFQSRSEGECAAEVNAYYRDVETILHSKAYARYADKTQVVYLFPHDHIASRGLHVQLVSSLARGIGRALGLNADLIEAISLGHDIGHAPFGHEGESYLDDLSRAFGLGAFSHSRQSCRVASEIEPMHLTFATLDGFLCHDGGKENRVFDSMPEKTWQQYETELNLRKEKPESDLLPATNEGALVKIADTVSYLERDLNDAITLGIVQREDLPPSLSCVTERSFTQLVADDIEREYAQRATIALSEPMFAMVQEIRSFNFERIYRHERLKTESEKIQNAYEVLFRHLLSEWKNKGKQGVLWKHFLHNKTGSYITQNPAEQLVVDYIAGMTDGYFLRLFEEIMIPRVITVPDVLPFSSY